MSKNTHTKKILPVCLCVSCAVFKCLFKAKNLYTAECKKPAFECFCCTYKLLIHTAPCSTWKRNGSKKMLGQIWEQYNKKYWKELSHETEGGIPVYCLFSQEFDSCMQ